MYRYKEWNYGDSIRENLTTTTNMQEGFHNKMRNMTSRCHSGMHEFMQVLLDLQAEMKRKFANNITIVPMVINQTRNFKKNIPIS